MWSKHNYMYMQLLLLLLCVEVWFFFSQSRACGTPLKTSLWTQGRHSHSSLIWQIPWSIWGPTIHHYLTKERLNTWSEEVDLCYTLNIHRYIFFSLKASCKCCKINKRVSIFVKAAKECLRVCPNLASSFWWLTRHKLPRQQVQITIEPLRPAFVWESSGSFISFKS